jgi:hypothetical protein
MNNDEGPAMRGLRVVGGEGPATRGKVGGRDVLTREVAAGVGEELFDDVGLHGDFPIVLAYRQ